MKKLKVLGYQYEVKRDLATNSSNACALFDSIKMEITLPMDKRPDQAEQSTLLHEAIEALVYHLELNVEHTAIMGIEAGIFQVLVDNGVDLSPLTKGIDE